MNTRDQLDQHTADRIFANVAAAMQEADEITGDMQLEFYIELMERIAAEATERAENAAEWQTEREMDADEERAYGPAGAPASQAGLFR